MVTRPANFGACRVLVYGLALAIAIELLTACLRFSLGLVSTESTTIIGEFTGGIRIHHGYVGVVMALLACWLRTRQLTTAKVLLIVGLGLLLSDVIHHFLVLWPLTGSPEFDWVYPPPADHD